MNEKTNFTLVAEKSGWADAVEQHSVGTRGLAFFLAPRDVARGPLAQGEELRVLATHTPTAMKIERLNSCRAQVSASAEAFTRIGVNCMCHAGFPGPRAVEMINLDATTTSCLPR